MKPIITSDLAPCLINNYNTRHQTTTFTDTDDLQHHRSSYPVEDVSNSFFDKVIVIIETWRVVSKLFKYITQPKQSLPNTSLVFHKVV